MYRIEITDVVAVYNNRNDPNYDIVVAHDAEGIEYTFALGWAKGWTADQVVKKVEERGWIDADKWSSRIPYGSDAWDSHGCEERLAYEERYEGLGEGDELAHVW